MEYNNIPFVDKKVSRIFYGTAMQPFFTGEGGEELFDSMYELGINAFDTARNYKLSEKALGTWLDKRGNREDVVVLSKCGHPDPDTWVKRINEKDIMDDLNTSLELLKTDYIDIYLMHRDDEDVEVGRIVEIFTKLHEDGRIKAYGGSNWTDRRIAEAIDYANKHDMLPMSVSSPNLTLGELACDMWGGGCVSISGPENIEARKYYERTQIPVISYASLARGFFSGKLKSTDESNISNILDEFAVKGYNCKSNFERLKRCEELARKKNCLVSQIAMAYVYSLPLNTFAIVASSSAERMKSNVDALSIKLTEDEIRYLE